MADGRYSLRRRQKCPLLDLHPLDEHLQPLEKSDKSESHTCTKCGRHFSHAHHFKKHLQTCTSSKTKARRTLGTFTCKTCGKVFSRSDWLRRHQEVHSKERPFRCKLCSASYKRRDALQRHELIQHTWPEEQVKKAAASESRCVKCGKVYMAGELTRHVAMAHSAPTQQPQTEPDSANISQSAPSQQPGMETDLENISQSTPSEQQRTISENKLSTTISGTVAGEVEKVYRVGAILQQHAQALSGTMEGKQAGTNDSGNKLSKGGTEIAESTPLNQLQQDTDLRNKLVEKNLDVAMTDEGPVDTESRGQTSQNLLIRSNAVEREITEGQTNSHPDENAAKLLDTGQEQTIETERAKGTDEDSEKTPSLDVTADSSNTGENGADAVEMSEEEETHQDDVVNSNHGNPADSVQDRHHCNACGDWLSSLESLARHEEKAHGIISFICPECDQLFYKIHLLEHHLSAHLGYTPHLCTVCKTSFRQEEDLRAHLEESHHFKDLQKCLYCSQTLPTRFHMNAHIRLLHEARRSWCQQCQKPITPFHTLNAHRKLVHSDRKLRCDECGAMFKSMLSLRAHIVRHRGTNACLCDYCGKRFNCKKELQGHVAKVHDPALKRHVCEICGHRTWIMADLMDHKYRLHPDQITENEKQKSSLYRRQKNLIRKPVHRYTCQQCDKKYMSMLHLQRHLALHDGTAHTCTACGQKFLKETDYRRHLATHGKTFSCAVCGKSFASKKNCERHELVTCRGEKEFRFTCGVCGKMVKYLSQYARHAAQHCSANATHACPVCRETFPAMPAFRHHIDDHVSKGETPWHCAVCNTYYEQQNRLVKHAKIHSDETPYLCPHCGKGFKDVAHLQVHENIHTRAKEYACKDCGRVFAQYSSMKRHELTHNKSQPHQCAFCDRRFSQKCSMDRHMRQHTGETPYVCEICGKGFKQSTLLHNHSKKVHQKLA